MEGSERTEMTLGSDLRCLIPLLTTACPITTTNMMRCASLDTSLDDTLFLTQLRRWSVAEMYGVMVRHLRGSNVS